MKSEILYDMLFIENEQTVSLTLTEDDIQTLEKIPQWMDESGIIAHLLELAGK